MCPWCFLTAACPCLRGGEPPGLAIGKLIVALARRLRRSHGGDVRTVTVPAEAEQDAPVIGDAILIETRIRHTS
jgi:hypothetical protein